MNEDILNYLIFYPGIFFALCSVLVGFYYFYLLQKYLKYMRKNHPGKWEDVPKWHESKIIKYIKSDDFTGDQKILEYKRKIILMYNLRNYCSLVFIFIATVFFLFIVCLAGLLDEG